MEHSKTKLPADSGGTNQSREGERPSPEDKPQHTTSTMLLETTQEDHNLKAKTSKASASKATTRVESSSVAEATALQRTKALQTAHPSKQYIGIITLVSRGPKSADPMYKGHQQRRDLRTLLRELPTYSYHDTNPTRKITYTRKKEKSSQLAERLLDEK